MLGVFQILGICLCVVCALMVEDMKTSAFVQLNNRLRVYMNVCERERDRKRGERERERERD